jgi:hypothetical protein
MRCIPVIGALAATVLSIASPVASARGILCRQRTAAPCSIPYYPFDSSCMPTQFQCVPVQGYGGTGQETTELQIKRIRDDVFELKRQLTEPEKNADLKTILDRLRRIEQAVAPAQAPKQPPSQVP